MLEAGIALLFLVPGLAAYSAIYGLFHNGRAIAPEPPSANTVEAVVIIVGASILIHAVTAGAFAINHFACAGAVPPYYCPVAVPAAWMDPYGSALRALSGGGIGGTALGVTLTGIVGQGIATYSLVRARLAYLARRDRLPAWIYGWAQPLADALDNDDTLVLAYVLTTLEIDGKSVAYGGPIHDIAMQSDGCISRIALTDCERYLVDMTGSATQASLSESLSRLAFLVIDAANIRNVAFETIVFEDS